MERTFLISESELRSINQLLNDTSGEVAGLSVLAYLAVEDGGRDVQGEALFGMSRTLRYMSERLAVQVDEMTPLNFAEASQGNVVNLSEVRDA